MPVAEFPGSFGWGYDGVDLFAPTRLYGRPDDMRRFVDAAHAARPGRDPRRRLQPPRARRRRLRPVLPALLHRSSRQRVGAGAQLRRRRLGPGAGVLHHQRRLLDRRVPPRRPPDRRRPGHLRLLPRAHPRRHHHRHPGRRPGAGGSCWWPRTSPRTRSCCGPEPGRPRPRRRRERRLPPQRHRRRHRPAARPT